MRKITIIYDGSIYTYKWIKSLLWAKKQFEEEGLSIEYLNWKAMFPFKNFASGQIDTALSLIDSRKLDIVLMAFHHSTSNFNNNRGLDKIELLKVFKDKCNRLIWLDTADSTGNCQFEVLPYVDAYLKKQLLKNLDLYSKKLYGTKLYTNYYREILGVEDDTIDDEYTLLQPQYKKKLKLSWNIGVSDFWTKARYCLVRPFHIFVPRKMNIESHRGTNMFFNGTLNYSSISGYQRRITVEKMMSNSLLSEPNPIMKLSHNQYVSFMKDAKTAISPFGWGEICYRDFESFVYGATLVKPDMSQILTFPDFFINYETYVPLDWDFGNFNEIVEGIGSEQYRNIAKEGQDLYAYYLNSKKGKIAFVNHVLSSILLD